MHPVFVMFEFATASIDMFEYAAASIDIFEYAKKIFNCERLKFIQEMRKI